MSNRVLVFYGSYRSDRQGIRLADWLVRALTEHGAAAELIDAKAIGLPMLDRMYKEYPKGEAPAALETLAEKIKTADAFVFVTGEYNWSVQPGLKNLTDHFLEEWYWRPAAIVSYSAGRLAGVRAGLAWHGILSEMGMVVVSSTIAVGSIGHAFDAAGAPARRWWHRPDPRLSALRRRPGLVDRGGSRPAPARRAAVLIRQAEGAEHAAIRAGATTRIAGAKRAGQHGDGARCL